MGKKILIVDDSKTIRQQASFTLEKGGFSVVEAENGQDALQKLASNPDVNLILSDLNMPVMTGMQLLENLQKSPATSVIPVIMLTTEGAADQIEMAKKFGAKGWLVKPFKPEILVAAITKIAR